MELLNKETGNLYACINHASFMIDSLVDVALDLYRSLCNNFKTKRTYMHSTHTWSLYTWHVNKFYHSSSNPNAISTAENYHYKIECIDLCRPDINIAVSVRCTLEENDGIVIEIIHITHQYIYWIHRIKQSGC